MILTEERTMEYSEYTYWIKQSSRIYRSLSPIRNDLELYLGIDMCRFVYNDKVELYLDVIFENGRREHIDVTDILRAVYSDCEDWELPFYEKLCTRLERYMLSA